MADGPIGSLRNALDPSERVSEVLFGLIMVLTFTGSLSIAEAGREDVRTMLVGALGCNLAWGVIDGVLFLMGRLAEKGSGLTALRSVRKAASPQEARQVIAGAMPPLIASNLLPAELDALSQRLRQLPEPPARALLGKKDWIGALSVFLLVFLSTFPVAVPFIFMQDFRLAMRISNGVAIVMLAIAGVTYARCIGRPPWGIALSMVALGLALVALTMALGG